MEVSVKKESTAVAYSVSLLTGRNTTLRLRKGETPRVAT